METRKRIGPRTLPCGIPLTTGAGSEIVPSTATLCVLSVRKARIHSRVWPSMM
ncbi:hypothetical protein DPMN_007105 [Dreissena polymorpha]|uniref:Uncharacterized protein n=1 Tax=Dreissena polymorpha TaxID=45954 RepID=A0A9D4RY02_DREPO|nr:hypothetical protein DPMN_007105 [Dreissena polymorpha]